MISLYRPFGVSVGAPFKTPTFLFCRLSLHRWRSRGLMTRLEHPSASAETLHPKSEISSISEFRGHLNQEFDFGFGSREYLNC